MSFLGQSLLPRGSPLLAGQQAQTRTRHSRAVTALVLAEAEAPATSAEQPASLQQPDLLPRPARPQLIWRAPPSERTMLSKEKQQTERMEAAQARFENRSRNGGGYGGGNGGGRNEGRGDGGAAATAMRPNRFQGGRGGGFANRGGQSAPPASTPGQAPADRNGRPAGNGRPGGTGDSQRWNGRGPRPEMKSLRGEAVGQRKAVLRDEGLDSRRKARQNRREAREERREKSEREDIFEVGDEGMSLTDLAKRLAVPSGELLKTLFMKGIMSTVNSTLDRETVKAIALTYGVEVLDREEAEALAAKSGSFLDEGDLDYLQPRPPVVTVMGHVDHGKTSLLDFIRKTKVAAGEAGGITQSIGAYTCSVPYEGLEKQVTFLDTPGHEAFSAMRARGAKVTDIAIIMVAADDGVRPQTIEAISHANAAGVPIVVAINKIDKEGANAERVKQELTEHGLVPEEWGGKTAMVPISAKKGNGVDSLLETVLLVAELEDLQANPERLAKGTVLEASLDKKSGPVATLLVQAGTLRVGDIVAAGSALGKVRTMRNPTGDVREAGPSIAVQMTGLSSVPQAGDEFDVFETESEARAAAYAVDEARRAQRLADMYGGGSMVTLSSASSMDEDGLAEMALQRINIILKADASGACEAVKSALGQLPQDSVMLRYLLAAPGEITMTDLDLAVASQAMVLGFNVHPSEAVQSAAKQRGIKLLTYNVIYDLVDDMRAAMEGRLKTVEERQEIGGAEVKAVFGSGNRRAAGCVVLDGALRKGCFIEVKRGKRTVFEGPLTSLRRVKDDVREVVAGTECGVVAELFKEWQEGDRITAYEVVEKRLKLEEAHAATVELDELLGNGHEEPQGYRRGRR
ncbi:hypothetical protein N2152v2_002351 [Parachlorella kessleri]